MYDHVLVGTDGSATATRAVTAAAQLAHAHDARLTIVHPFEPRPALPSDLGDRDLDELGWRGTPGGAAELLVQEAAAHARAASCGALDADGYAEPGQPVPVLLEAVLRHRPDVLVVGNADLRRPRLRRGIGTTLSKKAPVDVVIVDTSGARPRVLAS